MLTITASRIIIGTSPLSQTISNIIVSIIRPLVVRVYIISVFFITTILLFEFVLKIHRIEIRLIFPTAHKTRNTSLAHSFTLKTFPDSFSIITCISSIRSSYRIMGSIVFLNSRIINKSKESVFTISSPVSITTPLTRSILKLEGAKSRFRIHKFITGDNLLNNSNMASSTNSTSPNHYCTCLRSRTCLQTKFRSKSIHLSSVVVEVSILHGLFALHNTIDMVKATTCPTNTVRKNRASTIHWFTFDTTTLTTMTFSIIIRDIRIICLRHFSTDRERRISCIYITTARRTSISIAISRRIATSRRVIKTIKDSINDGTKCSTNFICYCIKSCTNTGINV